VTDDLARLIDHVKDLVGETDFSFKVSTPEMDMDRKTSGTSKTSSKGKKD
jgi:hypothetical protein